MEMVVLLSLYEKADRHTFLGLSGIMRQEVSQPPKEGRQKTTTQLGSGRMAGNALGNVLP